MSGVLIDWLSISVPVGSMFQLSSTSGKLLIEEGWRSHYAYLSQWIDTFEDWEAGKGRKVFDRSAFSPSGGMTIFWRDTLPYSLVEITGTGCAALRAAKLLPKFVELYGELLTRIDVTRDIECDTDPRVFAKLRDDKRFKSYEEKQEASGITYYVGSRSSDRYACVYRYAPPHPRSHLLRVEHRLKDDAAKSAAKDIHELGIRHVLYQLGNTFGWSHPDWKAIVSVGKRPAVPRDTKQGKTERWLLTSVLPALRGMLKAGGRSFVEYFAEQVYALLNDQDTSTGGQ